MKRLAFLAVGLLAAMPILARGFDPQQLIPVVVNTPGKNGTFYKTDFLLINDRNEDQDILVDFLPAGGTGGVKTFRYTVKANTALAISDFLGIGDNRINQSGVGSLLVTAVKTGTTDVDDSGKFSCGAEIWTEEPGVPGAVTSFFFDGAAPTTQGPRNAVIHGRQDAENRTNVAVTNFGSVAHTFTIYTLGTGGNPAPVVVTVPGGAMAYVPLPEVTQPSNTGYVTIIVTPDPSVGGWDCAAVSANNASGDGTAFWGQQL